MVAVFGKMLMGFPRISGDFRWVHDSTRKFLRIQGIPDPRSVPYTVSILRWSRKNGMIWRSFDTSPKDSASMIPWCFIKDDSYRVRGSFFCTLRFWKMAENLLWLVVTGTWGEKPPTSSANIVFTCFHMFSWEKHGGLSIAMSCY